MRKTFAFCVLLAVAVASALLCGAQAKASSQESQPREIVIQPNGTITPPSTLLQKLGNTYTLTGDIFNSTLIIQRGDVVVDGANHTLRGPGVEQDRIAITLTAINVTIQNMHITDWKAGVYGAYDNNTITKNTFTNNYNAIAIYACDYVVSQNTITQSTNGLFIHSGDARSEGDNNFITQNQIMRNQAAFDITGSNGTIITQNNVTDNAVILKLGVISLELDSGNHTIYQNNFLNNTKALRIPTVIFGGKGPEIFPAGCWDNGTVGNYWSNYFEVYPNASQIGNSGVGDKPYFIQDTTSYEIGDANGTFETGIAVLGTAFDHFPLINPVPLDISASNQPSPTATPNYDPTPSPTIPEFPTWTILLLLVAVSSVFLVRKKKN
ncbi:MAG: hypothetical protein NWF00_05385 [Candidatus Bathyarchaeota archaeon]|nr:hypothetical protein [Candidatus Bathyarchaeota archaeon]